MLPVKLPDDCKMPPVNLHCLVNGRSCRKLSGLDLLKGG